MFPAATFSPPYRLTPRYCGLLVRPFRLEPTPFLCAIASSAELQVGDADLGVTLPMSGLPAIVLPPLELEYVDLGFLARADHFTGDLGALDQRCAGLDGLTVGREQDLVEGDLGPRFRFHQREAEGLALFGLELFATGADDRVHVCYLNG